MLCILYGLRSKSPQGPEKASYEFAQYVRTYLCTGWHITCTRDWTRGNLLYACMWMGSFAFCVAPRVVSREQGRFIVYTQQLRETKIIFLCRVIMKEETKMKRMEVTRAAGREWKHEKEADEEKVPSRETNAVMWPFEGTKVSWVYSIAYMHVCTVIMSNRNYIHCINYIRA